MSGIIAFAGEVVLAKAVWDNVWGMTAQFKLDQKPHEKTTANPFKRFTKMRKGRVGTRFGAVFTFEDESICYKDEVMLKGWNDGTGGWVVTFWLRPDEESGLHPFMTLENGQALALAMVELDEDDTAINQVKRERVEVAAKYRKQSLSNYAAMLCRTPQFWFYLEKAGRVGWSDPDEDHTDGCSAWMRHFLSIKSRSELDTDPDRAAAFHTGIRKPYAEWMEGRS